MRFVVDVLAVGQGFLRLLWFSLVSIIPLEFHNRLRLNSLTKKDKKVEPTMFGSDALFNVGEHFPEKCFHTAYGLSR